MFDRGELRIEFDNNEEYQITQDEYLQELEDGTLTTSGFYRMRITDPEGNILYTDCWNFGESLREKYAPAGADNLLQVVNETPQLNGKLSIIYENIASTLSSLYDELLVYENGWEYLKSISKAASACFVSQPALTRYIQGLERELGLKLFNRTILSKRQN